MRLIQRPFLLLIVAVAGLLTGACGLFETRDPEPPTSGSSTFVPATSPDIVLSNLENAVSEKNTENYVRCLVDTLNSERRILFIPTSSAAGRYASTFSDWSLQSERAWFAALKAFAPKDAPSYLNLNGSFAVIAADSAIYEAGYEMVFRHGVANVSETVRGTLQFVMHIDRNSVWSITRWTDISLPDETSWSDWKGRFAN
ncbi:MAG: hypothetical protein IH600_12820 [Bacteroidetes bacterium]|nr:hypothetical protein [Bacteroidota bacterium]